MGRKPGAICVVLLMLAVASVPLIESIDLGPFGGIGEADAEASPEYIWSYTLSFTAMESYTSSSAVTVTASGYDHDGNALGTLTPYSSTTDGSWAFDSNGIGPLGSFYAAFDADNGNRMLCVLNPENLAQSIEGKALSAYYKTDGHANIMWVLPTVYWSVSNGALTLTNDPNSGGTAYAHTIIENGKSHVYQYMAIGVYEAYQDEIGSKKVITSQTGKAPTTLTSIAGTTLTGDAIVQELRAEAANQKVAVTGSQNDRGQAMIWNFYMWQLYRFTVAMTGQTWKVWDLFGNGDQGSKSQKTTGLLDAKGPFEGVTDGSGGTTEVSPVKAYIENAWGSGYDFVDGVHQSNGTLYLTQMLLSTQAYTEYETKETGYATNNNWLDALPTSKTVRLWGMPAVANTCSHGWDVMRIESNDTYLLAGGVSYYTNKRALGISDMYFATSPTGYELGESVARLAFVFDMDDYWGYEITPDGEVTGYGSAVRDPTPVRGDGTYVTSGGEYLGSWGFDSNGYGPFGSFYAAFDATKNNKMLCILDPNNLQYSITGKPLSDYGDGVKNIMWVLPTIYWLVRSNGNLYLTNDPAGGVAYAHTQTLSDGSVHTYKYMALGVYQASALNATSESIGTSGKQLTSQSGVKPTSNVSATDFQAMARMNTVATTDGSTVDGAAMLWNFYMWQLYRLTALTVSASWDSQGVFGNGDTYGGNFSTKVKISGLLDSAGPYAGTVGNSTGTGNDGLHSSPVKAFIENPWGQNWQLVGGVAAGYTTTNNLYVTDYQNPTWANIRAGEKIGVPYSTDSTQSYYGYMIGLNSGMGATSWGITSRYQGPASMTQQNYESGWTYDIIYTKSAYTYNDLASFKVGGMSWDAEKAQYAGLNAIAIDGAADATSTFGGTRLAFVFDGDPVIGAKAKVTSIAGVDSVQNISVRLEIPSASASGEGTLSLNGVYWIESGDMDAGEGVRAYGDLSTIDVTPKGITTSGSGIVRLEKAGDSSVKIQEMGDGTLRVTVTFQMKDADHHIYNVYAKYTSADGSYMVLSPTVFADDQAVPQSS